MCACAYKDAGVFSKLAAPRGNNPWDTSNQPQCMCDTCFFIQSSCLFIFHHHQNASCYFLPSPGQTNNRCGSLERSLRSTSPLPFPSLPPAPRLVCDNLCTLTLSRSLGFFFLTPEGCLSHCVGTRSCTHLPPAPPGRLSF